MRSVFLLRCIFAFLLLGRVSFGQTVDGGTAPVALARSSDSFEDRFLQLALDGADTIVRGRVVALSVNNADVQNGVELEVLEQLHGGLEPRRMYLFEVRQDLRARLRVGGVYLVAAVNRNGASPLRIPTALFDDTPAERARIARLRTPAWQRVSLVVLAHPVAPPSRSLEFQERYVFAVDRVLHGRFTRPHFVLNRRSFPLFAAPTVGSGTYLVSLHDAFVPEHMTQAVGSEEDLHRVTSAEVPTLVAEAARQTPRRSPLEDVRVRFQNALRGAVWAQSERIAEVRSSATSLLVANCGTWDVSLYATRWLRGGGAAGALFARAEVNECHPGAFPVADSTRLLFAAGTSAGGVIATMPATPEAERLIRGWMSAERPWYFGTAAVVAPTNTQRSGTDTFRVDAPMEMILSAGERSYLRFEVVSRVDTPMANGRVWSSLRCRRVAWQLGQAASFIAQEPENSVANEWYWNGEDVPAMQQGQRYFAVLRSVDSEARDRRGRAISALPMIYPQTIVPASERDSVVLMGYTLERYGR